MVCGEVLCALVCGWEEDAVIYDWVVRLLEILLLNSLSEKLFFGFRNIIRRYGNNVFCKR